MRNFLSIVIYFIIIALATISCQKESFYEGKDATLKFSMDTVSFDTVFSTIGTTTKRLMVYNPYNKKINIASITIAGVNSPFIININGQSTNKIYNIEISPNDSLYIFLQVYINPTGHNLPLIIIDSLICNVNGNKQNIKLIAYSQDVHIIKTQTIKTQIWEADKPYLLFGNITVDSSETLTIKKGAIIYLHKNSNLLVKGTLNALGEFEKPISFKGDRLEKEYLDSPGQWGGINLLPGSKNHMLNWLVIENGTSGIVLGSINDFSKPNLEISNSIIKNMSYSALLAYNAKIKAVNCLVINAATYTCGLFGGGDYEFYHCTLANYYGAYDNRNFAIPTLYLSNYFIDNQKPSIKTFSALTKANFYNSIIYGADTDELGLDSVATTAFRYKFDHCLIKSKRFNNQNTGTFSNNVWNSDPKFKMPDKFDFHLDTLSSAQNAGDIQIGKLFPKDLDNNDRTLLPDIGAYERIEK